MNMIIENRFEYLLQNLVNKGAFGTVYKGKEISSGNYVAIKVIDKFDIRKFGPEFVEAIKSECKVPQLVDSPYITKCYGLFEDGNNYYVVMEFCDGGTLNDILRKKRTLTEDECLPIFHQILKGINALAEKGISHRDLKPDNIFISESLYKLGDFGFSTIRNNLSTHLGTPPYMAPEILEGTGKYDYKVDIWALGVIIHEMLTGVFPFNGSQEEMRRSILQSQYVYPIDEKPISKEFLVVLKAMMEKSPTRRPTASQILASNFFNKLEAPIYSTFQPKAKDDFETKANILVEWRNIGYFLFHSVAGMNSESVVAQILLTKQVIRGFEYMAQLITEKVSIQRNSVEFYKKFYNDPLSEALAVHLKYDAFIMKEHLKGLLSRLSSSDASEALEKFENKQQEDIILSKHSELCFHQAKYLEAICMIIVQKFQPHVINSWNMKDITMAIRNKENHHNLYGKLKNELLV